MDLTVCENEEDLVGHLVLRMLNIGGKGFKHWAEEGWSSELDVW